MNHPADDDDRFTESLKTALRESESEVDFVTAAQLRSARARAVEAHGAPRHRPLPWAVGGPMPWAAGVATVAALTFAVLVAPHQWRPAPFTPASPAPAESAENLNPPASLALLIDETDGDGDDDAVRQASQADPLQDEQLQLYLLLAQESEKDKS